MGIGQGLMKCPAQTSHGMKFGMRQRGVLQLPLENREV